MTPNPKPAVLSISRSVASDIDAVNTYKAHNIERQTTYLFSLNAKKCKSCSSVLPDVMAPAATLDTSV